MVYRCRDRNLRDRVIALKLLFPQVTDGANFSARFMKEVMYSYEINHRNVVRTYDFIDKPEMTAITMEFVEGGDLHALIRGEEQLSFAQIVGLLLQMCAGVKAIHDVDVVHRDLKPENILITRDGVVKIADFSAAWNENATQLTKHGGIVGSLSYISPEYFEQGKLDSRTDLYALGVIAYEIITGVNPNEGATMVDVMRSRLNSESTPPEALRPDCPAELSRIVQKAMKSDPSQRYQTVDEMIVDLTNFATDEKYQLEEEDDSLSEILGRVLPRGDTREIIRLRRKSFANRVFSSISTFILLFCAGWLALGYPLPTWLPIARNAAIQQIPIEEQPAWGPLYGPAESWAEGPLYGPAEMTIAERKRAEEIRLAKLRAEELEEKVKKMQEDEKVKAEDAKRAAEELKKLQEEAKAAEEQRKAAEDKLAKQLAALDQPMAKPAQETKSSTRATTAEAADTASTSDAAPDQLAKLQPPPEPEKIKMTEELKFEYQVKAMLMYRFTDHITWNAERAERNSGKINLCILGDDTISNYLNRVAKSRKLKIRRKFSVKKVSVRGSASTFASCDMAFVSGRGGTSNKLVKKLHKAGVLTITERLSSGIISFFVRRGSIKFDINEKEAETIGVTIGPKLIQLSKAG